jgi:membrane fusion protein (multidrug efflux system)
MEKSTEKKSGRTRGQLFAGIGGCGVLILGGWFLIDTLLYVSTDNASVQGHAALLAFKVSGLVEKVLVDENEKVVKGQPLAKMRQVDFEDMVAIKVAEKEALVATLEAAKKTWNRSRGLLLQKAVSQEKADLDEANVKNLQARILAMEVQIKDAKQSLADSTLNAPASGRVGKKSLEMGMIISAGQPVFGFVEDAERWIVANLKETDLEYIRVGQHASISVDAASKEYEAEVESIAPATGSTFTLLPPDNATGNFTKVVQRVPVRLKLLNLTADDIAILHHGLSVIVKIRVR